MMFRSFLKRKRQQKSMALKQRNIRSEFKDVDDYAVTVGAVSTIQRKSGGFSCVVVL